ncbi:protein LLP homolog [Coccinella septempunctata]|uniref:protein LLP homolog n=1 Tax=Coccinella septempunctata TaxID=41139 RepID=UPI001D08967A|nr:protein LLP homolog [Coccinella septempunctata]
MAKSLRSKWKRKCRAVKRVRYGQKELERLKSILGVDKTQVKTEDLDISDIAEVKTVEDIKKPSETSAVEEVMDVDDSSSKVNLKKLRNKNGSYPVWLHPRKIPKKSKKQKRKIQKRKGCKS